MKKDSVILVYFKNYLIKSELFKSILQKKLDKKKPFYIIDPLPMRVSILKR